MIGNVIGLVIGIMILDALLLQGVFGSIGKLRISYGTKKPSGRDVHSRAVKLSLTRPLFSIPTPETHRFMVK